MNPEQWFCHLPRIIKLRLVDHYIRYLWDWRAELTNECCTGCAVKSIGQTETGYHENEIKSDRDLFPVHFPFDCLKNTSAAHYKFKNKYVYEVQDASIIGPYALGVTQDRKLIRDMIAPSYGRFVNLLQGSIKQCPFEIMNSLTPFAKLSPGTPALHLETACVLHSCWNNYFHWITEHLPKIRAVQMYREKTGRDVTIIVPPQSPVFVWETLRMLGVDEEKICEWTVNKATVKKLIVTTFPEMTSINRNWLRDSVIHNVVPKVSQRAKRRIYVSRQDASRRKIANEAELVTALGAYGFRPCVLTELSFVEQVQLFAESEVIVGPHGAGLTNILWCDRAKVIEVFGTTLKQNLAYARIADACDHQYSAVLAPVCNFDATQMEVNVSAVLEELEKMGIEKVNAEC